MCEGDEGSVVVTGRVIFFMFFTSEAFCAVTIFFEGVSFDKSRSGNADDVKIWFVFEFVARSLLCASGIP